MVYLKHRDLVGRKHVTEKTGLFLTILFSLTLKTFLTILFKFIVNGFEVSSNKTAYSYSFVTFITKTSNPPSLLKPLASQLPWQSLHEPIRHCAPCTPNRFFLCTTLSRADTIISTPIIRVLDVFARHVRLFVTYFNILWLRRYVMLTLRDLYQAYAMTRQT